MPKIDDFGRPIDQGVVALARAIRSVESGSNYNAVGDAGTSKGAYQWQPGNYEAGSKKYFGEVLDKNPINQDKIAYYQLLDLKKKGYSSEEVAAAWNAGEGKIRDGQWKTNVGTTVINGKKIKYDTPGYVNKVTQKYLEEQGNIVGLDFPKNTGGLQIASVAEAAGPSDNEIDPVEKALGGTGEAQGFKESYTMTDVIGDYTKGFVKRSLGTVQNIGNVIAKPLGKALGVPEEEIGISEETLKPEGTAQKVGAFTSDVAGFLLPAGVISKTQVGVNALIQGSKFLPSATRVAAKAGIEAIGGGAVSLAETGDLGEAVKTGALFGALKGVTGGLGELARAYRLPERIYSSIFKNTYQDVRQQLTTEGLKAFQKSDPEGFRQLVSSGIIKTGKGGVIVDDTIAKQALDRGLKGSLRNMANTVVSGLYKSEDAVRKIAAKTKAKVDMSEKQFNTVLSQIAQEYEAVGFGQFAQKAKALNSAIKASKGKVSVGTALEIRRLLDGLRRQSSYGSQSPLLSLSQQNLKFLSNTLRSRVNSMKGMGNVMENYTFYIEALEHLGKAAQRSGNNQIVSLIDSVFFSGAAMGNPAIGSALGLGRRILSTPASATRIGSSIYNSPGALTKTGVIIKGATTNLLPSQEEQPQ